MMKLTKIVTDPKYWGEDVLGDSKLGNIPIWYKHEIRMAKPLFNPMTLQTLSKEFVEKYGEGLGIYISVDSSGVVWWTGFCLFKNSNLFPDFEEEYPHMRIKHFDENWLELFSSSPDKERWEIKSLGDKLSSMKIDLAAKLIVLNNLGINGIQIQEDQTILIEPKKLIAGGDSSITIDSENGNITLDNNGKNGATFSIDKTVLKEELSLLLGSETATHPAVLGDQLQSWLTDLITSITTMTHVSSAPGSPTSPPINSAAFSALISRIPSLLSLLVKLDK